METWKSIPGYEGRYEVSDEGRVRSLDRYVPCFTPPRTRFVKGQVLRPGRTTSGHLTVALGKGNSVWVHSLVARAFLGPRPDGMEVLHGDHNPANNVLCNLHYGTRSENLKMDYAVGTRKVHPNFIGARWRA